jgi:hypothetical protein
VSFGSQSLCCRRDSLSPWVAPACGKGTHKNDVTSPHTSADLPFLAVPRILCDQASIGGLHIVHMQTRNNPKPKQLSCPDPKDICFRVKTINKYRIFLSGPQIPTIRVGNPNSKFACRDPKFPLFVMGPRSPTFRMGTPHFRVRTETTESFV